MPMNAKTAATTFLLSACVLVAACGGAEKGGNRVEMKDMEVVDGTASDAMTDLDGVQSEGTSAAMPDNAGNSTAATKPAPAEKSTKEDAEVLSDQ